MRLNGRNLVLLVVATVGCVSVQRQKLEADFRSCEEAENFPNRRFIGLSTERLDDPDLQAQIDRCQNSLAKRKARLAQEEAEAPAREAARLEAARKRAEYLQDGCFPLELLCKMACDKQVKPLSKLFQYNRDVCDRSVRLLHDACFGGGWDEVLAEHHQTTRGIMVADYTSRTVLGACLLSSNNTLDMQYASNETRTKCTSLAAAVKDVLVQVAVQAKAPAPKATSGAK